MDILFKIRKDKFRNCFIYFLETMNKMRWKSEIRSNIFFLIPMGMALYHKFFLYGLIIFLVTIGSSAFHISNKKKIFKRLDNIFAYLLIGYNTYICYLSHFKEPYFSLTLVFVMIGLYFLLRKNKDDYERHISSAIITIFCMLGYIAYL